MLVGFIANSLYTSLTTSLYNHKRTEFQLNHLLLLLTIGGLVHEVSENVVEFVVKIVNFFRKGGCKSWTHLPIAMCVTSLDRY